MIIAKVRLKANTSEIKLLAKYFDQLLPTGEVMAKVLRQVLILGVLRSIRQQFLANMDKAFEVRTAKYSLKQRVAERVATASQLRALTLAHDRMDKAVLSGRTDRLKLAQAAADKADRRVLESYSKRAVSRLTEERNRREARNEQLASKMRLGAITGALMRQRALRVLEYMTGAAHISDVQVRGNTAAVGAAPRVYLDAIETPSATLLLNGERSRSPFKTLWRHLEFGTGVDANRHQATLMQEAIPQSGLTKNDDGSWLYGRPGADATSGLVVLGTRPMRFLFTNDSVPESYAHFAPAMDMLDKAMRSLSPIAVT